MSSLFHPSSCKQYVTISYGAAQCLAPSYATSFVLWRWTLVCLLRRGLKYVVFYLPIQNTLPWLSISIRSPTSRPSTDLNLITECDPLHSWIIYLVLICFLAIFLFFYFSVNQGKERRLKVFENRVLRRVFGPKRDEVTREWRKLHNEELNDLYTPYPILCGW
jgi:hypothetical protein